jgi:hypothetical protein
MPGAVTPLAALAGVQAAAVAAAAAFSLSPRAPPELKPWLEVFWPFVGVGMSTGVLAVLLAGGGGGGGGRRPGAGGGGGGGGAAAAAAAEQQALVRWAALVLYTIHQLEEWGVDLRGKPYAFYDHFNGTLAGRGAPLSRLLLGLGVNVGVVWVSGLAGAAAADAAAGLPLLGIIGINALVHAATAARARRYHPGLATALLLFLPLSVRARTWGRGVGGGEQAAREAGSVVAPKGGPPGGNEGAVAGSS